MKAAALDPTRAAALHISHKSGAVLTGIFYEKTEEKCRTFIHFRLRYGRLDSVADSGPVVVCAAKNQRRILPLKSKSHVGLGHYLADRYLSGQSWLERRAFMIGCIEPDRNPATYVKGSRKHERLRGHNFPNARNYMRRLTRRLGRRGSWGLVSFYELGKLVHYIVDSFTFAHSGRFEGSLVEHLAYEERLQRYFLAMLKEQRFSDLKLQPCGSVYDMIMAAHETYDRMPGAIETDALYAIAISAQAVQRLYGLAFAPNLQILYEAA